MSAAPAQDPVRHCEHCGEQLTRKRRPNGGLERPGEFARRLYCNTSCTAKATGQQNLAGRPAPQAEVIAFPAAGRDGYLAFSPLDFTRAYQEALARGVDLLELNDATWEA